MLPLIVGQVGDFASHDPRLARGLDADADGLSAHLQDGDDNVFADLDLLLYLSRQHEHGTHSFAWFRLVPVTGGP
ncbi:MAG TPA: hypothetical protein PK867_25870 [Pirellulales bacterium]|nr:hypothetical protein [Pirellulales bacterium]